MSALLDNLPAEWEFATLGDINTKKATTLNPKNYSDETFEYYSIPDFQRDQQPSLTKGGAIESSKLLLEPNTVLFGKLNPRVEKVWRVVDKTQYRQIGSTEWITVLPDERVDRDFLYFLEWSPHVMPIAKTLVSGSTPSRQRVDPKSFYRLRVPLPPLPEQKKIAHILSTVQQAIEAQERIIQTTTELKKALMHKLFTEGLRNEPQKQTEIGPIPESWEVVELGQHIQIAHGYAFKGEFFVNDGPTVLTPGNFKLDGGLYWGKRTKYTTESYDQSVVLNPGELVVVMTDLTPTAKLLGGPAFIPEGRTILHNQRIGKVALINDKTTLQFLYWVFLSDSFKRYMRQTATGSTVRHTSPSKIYQYSFGLPSLDEQTQTINCLAKVDAKIANSEDKRQALQDLFRTLLHELMTAKTRVHNLKIEQ